MISSGKLTCLENIMGKNFFGPKDYKEHFLETITAIPDFPWDINMFGDPCQFIPGKYRKNTHFIFLGLQSLRGNSMNMAYFQKLYTGKAAAEFKCGFAAKEIFHFQTLQFRWYALLKKNPISSGKIFIAQEQLLTSSYEVPSAAEESAKNLFFFLKNGIILNEGNLVRTRDKSILCPGSSIAINFGKIISAISLPDKFSGRGVRMGASIIMPS